MTNLLNRFTPNNNNGINNTNNDSPTKSPVPSKEKKSFQLFRKIEQRFKNNKGDRNKSSAPPLFSAMDSKEFSNELILGEPTTTSGKRRPDMTRLRSNSLRLSLLKSSSSSSSNQHLEGSFRTNTMPRRRSSVRIAKHMGSSRKLLLCRMTSQDQLVVKPHQVVSAEGGGVGGGVDGGSDSYVQLEILPTNNTPKQQHDDDDEQDDDNNDKEDADETLHHEDEDEDVLELDDDDDDLSTASDPMCYLPVRAAKHRQQQQQQQKQALSSDYYDDNDEEEEMTKMEKHHKSLSSFPILALFLNGSSSNTSDGANVSSSSRRGRSRSNDDAQTHC